MQSLVDLSKTTFPLITRTRHCSNSRAETFAIIYPDREMQTRRRQAGSRPITDAASQREMGRPRSRRNPWSHLNPAPTEDVRCRPSRQRGISSFGIRVNLRIRGETKLERPPLNRQVSKGEARRHETSCREHRRQKKMREVRVNTKLARYGTI